MRILSFIVFFFILFFSNLQTESPHGADLKISCGVCHSSKGWQLDKEIYSFNHNTTTLPLVGQHTELNCRQCHPTLVFGEAKSECNDCHKDVHQATVGSDCSRCHTPVSWLVNNITEIHQMSRFPLLGAHRTADCSDCHKSENMVRFDVAGVECINCHREDYISTTVPNHSEAGFSQDCSICHPVVATQWTGAGFNHNFFPLTLGHATPKCIDCHTGGNYTTTPTDCYECHKVNYDNTINPNHQSLGFSINCTECHSTNPDWKPASYRQHDSQSFPIYSGKHNGEWNNCTDCHTTAFNYSVFSCINCHEHNKAEMDNKHKGESGYSYNSAECFRCHPRGDSD